MKRIRTVERVACQSPGSRWRTAVLWVILPLASMLLLQACGGAQEHMGDPGPYWDSKAFFESEADRLNAEAWGVDKRVLSPEGEEHRTLDSTDWHREWAAVLPFDLAHPEREGRYTIDSNRDAGGYTTVRYRATEEKLHPQSVAVWWTAGSDGQQVVAVHLKDSTANWLYQSGLEVLYEAADGRYRIDATNTGFLFKDSEFHIEGIALKRE